MKIQVSFKILVLTLAILLGMTAILTSCSNEEIAQEEKATEAQTDKNLTTFMADNPESDTPSSRTSMSTSGDFKWEAGDRIYVKDDDGIWQVSSNSPTSSTSSFKFLIPGKFVSSTSYKVYYPGKNGSNDQVSISANQFQNYPNDPSHVGVSGDYGWADATKEAGTNRFNFKLDHKAAFLVFSPYTSNSCVQNNNDIKLTKIEVNSDNEIVGTFILDPAKNQLIGTGSGKQINLTIGGNNTPNGFAIPASATPAINGSYIVIKPGNHTLKVRFWVKDYVTKVEGTVTISYPSYTYTTNTYYTMPSSLNIKDYNTPYYMWDAQQNYWVGHEWNSVSPQQPTLKGKNNGNYPQSKTADPLRWYNEAWPGNGIRNDAVTPLFKTLPNANELSWYAMKGDPHWDADEPWTTMGHLYKGGMWFKKKVYIAGFKSTVASDGTTDLRTTYTSFNNKSVSSTPLTATEQANYFYLPALGYYRLGTLYNVGGSGNYWSLSARSWNVNLAYSLGFASDEVGVISNNRDYGYQAIPFK